MAFVVTSGQLSQVQQDNRYVSTMGLNPSLTLSPALTMTYGALWRAQPALRSVTSFLARNVASLPLDVYRRLDGTDREKDNTHALARLLAEPMIGGAWTKYRLLNTLMLDLLIFDAAYWLKMTADDGRPCIQPIPPAKIVPHGGGGLFATTGYRITGNRGYIDVPADRVVAFHGYNPDDQQTGCAPVETLRQILSEEFSASIHREQMWRSGARVSGYLTRPAGVKWSPESRERFRGDWSQLYSGNGPSVGGTPILEDGMDFHASGVTPREAQAVEFRKLTREEVAVSYHMSPVMMGIIDGTTISSVMELHKMLYQDTLPPWLTQISQDIERQLLPDLDLAAAMNGAVFVEFNLKAKLAGSFEEQAQALQSAVGGPWMVRNEARAMNNLPEVDGGDDLIVPLNVLTGGLASPNDTAPDNPDNGPSNGQLPKSAPGLAGVLRKHFQRQGQVIGSKCGAGVAPPPLSFWDDALTADVDGIAPGLPVKSINAATHSAVLDALKSPDPAASVAEIFTNFADVRADQIARDWEQS